MTHNYRCDDKERLIAYLYGEESPADRALIEEHLARCANCAEELSGLRAVRGDLADWVPPEIDLGFRVVQEEPVERGWRVPVWAQALAAVVVLVVGAAIANVQVRYDDGGVTVRTGWQTLQPVERASVPAHDAAWRKELALVEQRLRSELAARPPMTPASVGDTMATESAARARTVSTDAELLDRVRALIEASEKKQQRELALRLAQLVQDVDAQRRADLVRIENSFGRIEGMTGQEAARQRELLNYLVRVSQRQ